MDISGLLFNGLSPDHSPTTEIVRAEFDGNFIAGTEDDPVSTHVSAEVGVDCVVFIVL